jgi:hypothetical protein
MNIFSPAATSKIRSCIAIASASSAAIGLTFAIAFAQQPQTAGPVSLGELFTGPDSVTLKGDSEEKIREAAAKANDPRGCPQKAKFTVRVGPGDRTFQGALAAARRDRIKDFLQNQPGRFDVTDEVGGSYDVQVDYDRMPDREPPKLHMSSVPPKGTKVRAGDRIKITMTARDDATPTQTGIQSIQLLAQGPGGDERVGGENYRPVVRPNCEGRPEPRTLEVTYTVPNNPPPIVKLVAITEDFVNLTDVDRAEFPTGDLAGRFHFSRDHPAPRGINLLR